MSGLIQIYDELNHQKTQKSSQLSFSDLASILTILITSNPDKNNKFKDLQKDLIELNESYTKNLNNNDFAQSKCNSMLTSIAIDLQDINHIVSEAASSILDSLQEFDESERKKIDKDHLSTSINENCGFHDLVGQRINRILKNINMLCLSIQKMEASAELDRMISSIDNQHLGSSNENLLHGPSKLGTGMNQIEIDSFFKKDKKATK